MVGCDFCGEWYHGCCVGLTEEESLRIEKYKCPLCALKGNEDPFYNDGN